MASAHIIQLRELSSEDSWSLFSQIAFSDRGSEDCKDLEQFRLEIVDKCKGLPLALKTLGSHLRFKKSREQWQNVLDSKLWDLEEIKKGLFAPLLLSFYDLPSTLKHCFSYCAIYPKDEKIRVDKLIKLWMAQGYLIPKGSIDLEMIGQEYFEYLAMRSFFQNFEKYAFADFDSIETCQMHDIVHDFAQSLTKNECFEMKVDENKELGTDSFYKAHHLTLTSSTKQMEVPSFVYKAKNLRTLVFAIERNSSQLLKPDLFLHLTSLRTLNFSHQSITEVPKEVERLIHLRYLDLSSNRDLKELPEAICNLCNLQTLDISWCNSLTKLPQGMGKLVNLRHLNIYPSQSSMKSFPKGFRRLSSLRNLRMFNIPSNDDSEGCKLGELKILNHLRGELKIKGLGNLIEVCEAENAQLKKKIHLRKLYLVFNGEGEEYKRMENDEVLLNALEPHPDLQRLFIRDYHGTKMFSNWQMSIKLKILRLRHCTKLECLPPLGRLPFLEAFSVWEVEGLKKVGVEFLGIPLSSSSSFIFFPSLKSLKFNDLQEWEEWDGIGGMGEEEKDVSITIMPCLHSLEIVNCPNVEQIENLCLSNSQPTL